MAVSRPRAKWLGAAHRASPGLRVVRSALVLLAVVTLPPQVFAQTGIPGSPRGQIQRIPAVYHDDAAPSTARTRNGVGVAAFLQPAVDEPRTGGAAESAAPEGPQAVAGQPQASRELERRGDPSRLELLPAVPRSLVIPQPDSRTRSQYDGYLERTVDPEVTLDLIAGRPRILVFRETPRRVFLPDEEIATFQVISASEISLLGRSPGRTVLNVWVADPGSPRQERVLSYLINVYPEPRLRETLEARYAALEQEINQAFPNSQIRLSMLGDRLLVRGEAKDSIETSQILQVLAQNAPQGARGVLQDRGQSTVYLYDDRDPLLDREIAGVRRSVIDTELLAAAGIINLLRIPGEQQVMLRVTVAEVNRSALRSIGADTQIGGSGDVSFLSLALPGNFPTTGGNLSVVTPDFRLALNALRQLGYARTLAEPNLTTLNGRPAVFQAGDRLPVPLAQAGFGGVGQGLDSNSSACRSPSSHTSSIAIACDWKSRGSSARSTTNGLPTSAEPT